MNRTYKGSVPATPFRKIVTLEDGTELERQMIYMTNESWEALRRLCIRSKTSGSRCIAQLIAIADATWK